MKPKDQDVEPKTAARNLTTNFLSNSFKKITETVNQVIDHGPKGVPEQYKR